MMIRILKDWTLVSRDPRDRWTLDTTVLREATNSMKTQEGEE